MSDTQRCEPAPYPEYGWWLGLSRIQVTERVLCHEHGMDASTGRDAAIQIENALEEAFPPVTPPAVVAALVEALEMVNTSGMALLRKTCNTKTQAWIDLDVDIQSARAALAAYRGDGA